MDIDVKDRLFKYDVDALQCYLPKGYRRVGKPPKESVFRGNDVGYSRGNSTGGSLQWVLNIAPGRLNPRLTRPKLYTCPGW